MTRLDDKMLPKVKKMLAKYGKLVSWTNQIDGGTFDPLERDVSGDTPVTHDGVLITPPHPYKGRLLEGDTIKVGDSVTYLAGQDIVFTPSAGWQVVIDGATWTAVAANPLYSGSSIAAWEVILRR